jgi:hypothetical protein
LAADVFIASSTIDPLESFDLDLVSRGTSNHDFAGNVGKRQGTAVTDIEAAGIPLLVILLGKAQWGNQPCDDERKG